jgi:peptidoglycan hydrolase CwlO-like protein
MAVERGFVPVPDPTKLTTDAVDKAKADIEKLFDVKLHGFRELVTEKFAGRDTALAAALKAAQELVKQQNDSNTLAIDKAGASFSKQIDSLDEKISDLKERVSELSGRNWTTVGAYIVGAVGIAALVASALLHHG